mgnify:CR=1 FL=1
MQWLGYNQLKLHDSDAPDSSLRESYYRTDHVLTIRVEAALAMRLGVSSLIEDARTRGLLGAPGRSDFGTLS